MTDEIGASETPEQIEILRALVSMAKDEIFVCLPGKIEKYDASKQVADVKPLIKDPVVFEDGSEGLDPIPVIPGVPVIHPRGNGFYIHMPLKKGDNVLLLFSDRAIDSYMESSGAIDVDPEDLRAHDVTDAIAIPGWTTTPKAIKDVLGNDFIIGKEGKATIKIKESGQVSINDHVTVDP